MTTKRIVVALMLVCIGAFVWAGADVEQSSAATQAKPDLSFLWEFANFNLAEDPGIAEFEQITGYTVSWNTVPEGQDGQQKVLLELSAGERYDLVMVAPGTFPTMLRQNVATPLDDLIAEYAPNITDQIPARSMAIGQWEGQQYGLPRNIPNNGIATSGLLFRNDILESLNLSAPRTIEALRRLLVEVKRTSPKVIPFSFEAGDIPPAILSGFGLTGDWQQVDGTWVHPVKNPAFRRAIGWLNGLYREGLLDQEMPAMNRNSRWERFSSGRAAVIKYQSGDYYMFQALHENVPDAEYLYAPVLLDSAGRGRVLVLDGYNAMTFVPKTARNPEHALSWINITLEPDTFRRLYIGTEGESWELVDGGYRPLFPAFNDFNKRWWYFPLYDDDMAPQYWRARVWKTDLTAESYLTLDSLNEPFKESSPLAFSPLFESVAQYGDTVEQYQRDEVLKFIVGTRPMSQWSQFLTEIDAKGLSQIESEVRGWLQ